MKAELTINVQIGVTPEVTNLVMALLHKENKAAAPATTAAPAASVENPTPEAPAAPAKRRGKAKAETQDPAPEASAEAAPAENAGQAQEPAPEPENKADLTEEDVRESMHRTRTRIEGEGYKDNTEMEGRKKYHAQLTATFKQISALLGADKPSALPADQRASFIKQCDELEILENGSIGTKLPY